MDRAVLILSALMLNAALGGPRQLYAPLRLERLTALPASIIGKAQRKLDREHRSLRDRELRGAVVVVLVFLASVLAGWLLGWIFSFNLQFAEIVLMAALLPVRPTFDRVRLLHARLAKDDLLAARATLENTPWRHSALLDAHGMARAGIEYLAVQFSAKILAPCLWYAVCGLPGMFFIRGLYLMVENLNMPEGQAQGFGRLAYQVHRALDYIPSRFAGFMWVGASYFLSGAAPKAAFAAIVAEGPHTPDSQTFALMSVAQVLQVSLGGPMSAYGDKRWWGRGSAKVPAGELSRALYLFAILHLFLFIVFGLLF